MRNAAIALIATLVVIPFALWAVPAINGPFFVDCGPLERALCDETWPEWDDNITAGEPLLRLIPVTGVTFKGGGSPTATCGDWTIHRYGLFDMTAYPLCGS